MMVPSSRSVNPYTGNPYLYGSGPEHNWFIDERGNVLPAPQQPAPLPLPGENGPADVPSLFEGDGARGGEAYTPGGVPTQDTWPDMTGPALADVLAALAQPNTGDIRGYSGQPMETEPPASWAGADAPPSVDFMDDTGMMADRAAEEAVLGDRATTRAHEFDEPTFTEAPPAAGAAPAAAIAPGFAELSAPIGGGGLVGSIGTDLSGWGANIGGHGQGAIAGLVESMLGNMQPGNTNPAEVANSPQGRAALDFASGLLSRSPDEFSKFGDRATLGFENKSGIAGTNAHMSSYVDPSVTFAAPEPLEFVPDTPPSVNTGVPGYSPGPAAPAAPASSFLDLLDLEKTPVIDQETLTPASNPMFSFDQPEVISQDTGALGLLGVDEDMLGGTNGDLIQSGSGTDDLRGGMTNEQIQGMYNEPNIGVGQPGFAGGTMIGDLQRAVEMISAADDYSKGTTNTSSGGHWAGGYNAYGEPVMVGSDKQGATGQDKGDTGGGSGGSEGNGTGGAPGNNGQDGATSPDQDSTGGTGAGGTGSGSAGAGGGCYLTTAAVDHMGLPDNGPHLQTLRWYRDKIMRRSPAGRRMIAEYNRVAPKAVKSLNGRADAPELYKAIFSGYIDPAAKAITEGKYDKADAIYGSMVKNVADITGVE